MAISAQQVLNQYLSAQASGDLERVMALIAPDAVFDVGRGRYEGAGIRKFHQRLQDIHSVTIPVETHEADSRHVTAIFEQSDDDLAPLGIGSIKLNVDVRTNEDGQITHFTARPTRESLALIKQATSAGRTSEGTQLAQDAGNL